MKVLLAVVALVAMANAASLSQGDLEFHAWKLKIGKSYGSAEEESQRKMIWLDNLKLVLEHNLLADQGLKSYRLGMNQFGDMSNQEYQAMFGSCLKSFNTTETQSEAAYFQPEGGAPLPDTVDWRANGSVTAVKHQLKCGSCWAFSATGALEGQMFKKTGKLISLSEQQLVDCSFSSGNNGCEGGLPWRAFKYINASGGLEAQDSYPYQDKEGKCRFNEQKVVATCRGYLQITKDGSETALQEVVASVGPVSVLIDTSHRTFQLYESGVFDDKFCRSTELTHAVLVVGYGREHNQDYWLVKNSWGVNWGEDGYIKMSRNKNNQCGIATQAVYPDV